MKHLAQSSCSIVPHCQKRRTVIVGQHWHFRVVTRKSLTLMIFSIWVFVAGPSESSQDCLHNIIHFINYGWSGRIWGRTGCNFDKSGHGSCQTGSCGDTLKCGASGKPPASLAEFTLAQLDFYDVSLVDGFNVPISVKPINGKGNCSTAGCDSDLRSNCPNELAVKVNGKTVACRSACDVFNADEYCCRGVYGNPVTCKPTFYSKKFKEACPTSYSYAYDDPTSIFTCAGTDYVVAFCASRKKQVCTYHGHKLHCSGSQGLKSLIGSWLVVMITGFSMLSLWILF